MPAKEGGWTYERFGCEYLGFVNEADKTVQEQDYDTNFQKVINRIHEYPTCEN